MRDYSALILYARDLRDQIISSGIKPTEDIMINAMLHYESEQRRAFESLNAPSHVTYVDDKVPTSHPHHDELRLMSIRFVVRIVLKEGEQWVH